MVTKDDVEQFLNRLSADGASVKEVQNGLWVVKPSGSLEFDLVVHFNPPVVVLRVKVMELPDDIDALASLTHRLLEMNASEMLHGSYGIEQDAVVITEALELSHLDYEEFRAVYESINIALASHIREIGQLGTTGSYRVPAARKAPTASPGRNGSKKTKAAKTVKKAARNGNSKKGARGAKRSGSARGRR